jgi:ankyrin repeat protein
VLNLEFMLPGHCEATRLLLSKGVPVGPLSHRGTPLHLAVAKDQDETVKILLEHGAVVRLLVCCYFGPSAFIIWEKI